MPKIIFRPLSAVSLLQVTITVKAAFKLKCSEGHVVKTVFYCGPIWSTILVNAFLFQFYRPVCLHIRSLYFVEISIEVAFFSYRMGSNIEVLNGKMI